MPVPNYQPHKTHKTTNKFSSSIFFVFEKQNNLGVGGEMESSEITKKNPNKASRRKVSVDSTSLMVYLLIIHGIYNT